MHYWFSFLFPRLMILWLFQLLFLRARKGARDMRAQFGLALASAILVLLPVQGLPLGRWLAALNFQPSIPLFGLLANLVWKNSFQKELLSCKTRATACVFGGTIGMLLYPLSLGLGNFDPYSQGWSFSLLFPIAALTTILLLCQQNGFGFLLLLSVIAYDLQLLESNNFLDYLVDPLYWLLCLAGKSISEALSTTPTS